MHTKTPWVIQNQVPLIPVWVHWFLGSHQHLQRLKGCSRVWGRGIKEQQQGKHRACSALVDTLEFTTWCSDESRGHVIIVLMISVIRNSVELIGGNCVSTLLWSSSKQLTDTWPWWGLLHFKVRACSKSFVITTGTRREFLMSWGQGCWNGLCSTVETNPHFSQSVKSLTQEKRLYATSIVIIAAY